MSSSCICVRDENGKLVGLNNRCPDMALHVEKELPLRVGACRRCEGFCKFFVIALCKKCTAWFETLDIDEMKNVLDLYVDVEWKDERD